MSASLKSNAQLPNVAIEKQSYYHGLLPREDVKALLLAVGDFVVRISEPKAGENRSYIISAMIRLNNFVLNSEDCYKHYVITQHQGKFIFDKYSFDSVPAIIAHYVNSQESLRGEVKLLKGIKRQFWELDHENVTISKKLGEGAFGEVSKGMLKLRRGNKQIPVAIKQVKLEKVNKEQIKEFMLEARLMRLFNHQHVVQFYGVAVTQEPLYLVMELATNGSLNSFLVANPNIDTRKKTEMVLQAAWGLEYLHSIPVIHRDLAARNCLYGDGKVKIADFGLTRPGRNYQMDASKKVPIKWLAVETIQQQIYTQASDVWSWGIMSWEIYHNAKEPYPGMSIPDIVNGIKSGYRMPFEIADINAEITKMIIEQCWNENPLDRLPMTQVSALLERVSSTIRPDFVAIANNITAAMTNLNAVTVKTNRRKNSKAMVPGGLKLIK